MEQTIMITAQKNMQDINKILLFAQPIRLMGNLKRFLLSQQTLEWSDTEGHMDMRKNYAQNSFLIYKGTNNAFFEKISDFSYQKNVFLLNALSKEDLEQKEKIFTLKNRRTKEFLNTLKEEYFIHKVNKNFFEMIHCIKTAEKIVSGQIKVH